MLNRYRKNWFFLLILILLPNWSFANSYEEGRGIWIVRHSLVTKESIRDALYKAKQNNFNMVLIQVVGRGDAFYNSAILPQTYSFVDKEGHRFDPLEYAIELGHSLGLQVHAWVNVYYVWSSPSPPASRSHVYYAHPEWMMVDNSGISIQRYSLEQRRDAGVEGNYLSPGIPGVRQFLRSIVREIVENYDVDGIHLDYVRYPSARFSFDTISRARFERTYRVDPLELMNGNGNWSSEEYHQLLVTWKDWRADQVTKLVRGIFYDIQARDRKIALSAAVIADLDYARTRYGQRWDEWLHEEIIDFVVPMAYSTSTQKVVDQLSVAQSRKYKRHVYAGIGVYNQSAESAIEKIYRVRNQGVDGIVLFSYDGIKNNSYYFDALRRGPLSSNAVAPKLTWKQDKPKSVVELFPLKSGRPKWTLDYLNHE